MARGIVSSAIEVGSRRYQEDRFVVAGVPKSKKTGWLLGVMDGHAGVGVSHLCSERLEEVFSNTKEKRSGEGRLREVFSVLHNMTREFDEGSTFSAAWVRNHGSEVAVGTLGDSPVIVVDKSGGVHLSTEHNARTNLKERQEAEKRGGRYADGYIENSYGEGLQLTRALGDKGHEGIISREPEFFTVKNPAKVILASDGILDPQHGDTTKLILELVKLVEPLDVTADDIMAWAKARGLSDNATVLLWKG